jgi:hypothetical protein
MKRKQCYTYLALGIVAIGIGLFFSFSYYEVQGLLLVLAGITIIATIILPRLAKIEPGNFLLKVLVAGLIFRTIFCFIDYWIGLEIYGGTADAFYYHMIGTEIAGYIRILELDKVIPYIDWSSNFIYLFTGIIYSIIGPTILGCYVIFSFLAFLGSYYFYKAFSIAFPEGNKRFYAIIIFFLPSILFWANGIGKDSLIFFSMGLFAYGSSRLIRLQFQGLVPFVIGFLVRYLSDHI